MATVVDLSKGGSLSSAMLSVSSYIPPVSQMSALMTTKGNEILDSFSGMFDSIKARTDGVLSLQRELGKDTNIVNTEAVYEITDIDHIFNANPIMKSCISGHPYVRQLYKEGYDLYDEEPSYDDIVIYRESRSGMLQIEDDIVFVDEHISHGYDDLPTFTLDDKIIMEQVYEYLSTSLLRSVIDDYQEDELE